MAGQLEEAREHYSKALEIDHNNFDAWHMLGVVEYQLDNPETGVRHILRAIKVASPALRPATLTNLGLCLAAVARKRGLRTAPLDNDDEYCYPSFLRRATLAPLPMEAPGISVVVPSYNHERYVVDALRSVFTQDYPAIELVVIDDGSTDKSGALIRETLAACPFPHRFIARENRGAHETLNEAIGLATHDWVTALNSDDCYAPRRIELMMRALLMRNGDWGYSGVTIVDEHTVSVAPGTSESGDHLLVGLEERYRLPALNTGFSRFNHAISAGNLVFRKTLWSVVGGFPSQRYVHGWGFCLRALLQSEPVFIDEPLYVYRMHAGNTIVESVAKASAEWDILLASWLGRLSSGAPAPNPVLERFRNHHLQHEWRLMSEAKGHLIDLPRLRKYVNDLGLA